MKFDLGKGGNSCLTVSSFKEKCDIPSSQRRNVTENSSDSSTKGRIKRGREQKDEADIRKKMGIIFLLALFEKKRKKTYTYLQKEDKKKKNIHVSLSLSSFYILLTLVE